MQGIAGSGVPVGAGLEGVGVDPEAFVAVSKATILAF